VTDINDFLDFGSLHVERSVESLKNGEGFVASGLNTQTAAINTQFPAEFIALLEFLESEPRGNHYHREKIEVMVVLNGELLCEFRLPEDDEVQISRVLTAGEYVRVAPQCVHTFTAINGNVVAIEYGSTSYAHAGTVEVSL
jgi:dTDP-4-dehydrorhamnose 3,5-epimerase-like enzyme